MSELSTVVSFTLVGLGTGALYALCALGIVAIHRGSKTINFAAGGIALWAALSYEWLTQKQGWPTWPTFALLMVAGSVFGAAVYTFAIRPVRHRTPLARLVLTTGIYAALTGLAQNIFQGHPLSVPSQVPMRTVTIPLVHQPVGENRLILLAVAVVVTCLLALWSARSRLAIATRAMSEHERGAQALGASPHLLGALNWALGCALAAAAGMLVAPIIGLTDTAISAIVVFALTAALLGRFDSFWLALVGGLVLGVGQSLMTRYAQDIFGQGHEQGWPMVVPLVFIVIVLLARRDHASNRLPAVSANPVASGRFAPLPAAVAVAVAAAVIAVLPTLWLDAAVATIGFAILALSLVVLIGYANQVSLAQMAIAGLGAFAAGRLASGIGLPFELAPLAGAAAGAVCGLLVGLPALRIRGVNLAVVTLAMGLAVEQVLFDNTMYTGGQSGLAVPRPTFLGADVENAIYGRRYAYVALLWLVLAALVVVWVRRSRLGRRLLGIRTNERAAMSLGTNVARAKLAAFVISAGLAGMAGVLLSFRNTVMTFESYGFNDSINVVVIATVAGVSGVISGVAAGIMASGGLLWYALHDVGFLQENYSAIFGAGLVLAVIAHPNGVAWLNRWRRDATPISERGAPARPPEKLAVERLRVSFGGVSAVRDVDLTVEPGLIVGLVGPNGAGKSSVLDAIGGFARAEGGEMRLADQAFTRTAAAERGRMGIARVFQGIELFEDLTVAMNLRVAAESAGSPRGQLPDVALDALRRLDLTGDLERLPGQLPLAKRKFVGIVRALAANPSVLLLDEPGAGLGLTERDTLSGELRHLATECGLGIVLVDHDIGLVMSVCDRVVVLQNGRVLAEGAPSDVAAREDVRLAYLGDEVHSAEEHSGETVPEVRP